MNIERIQRNIRHRIQDKGSTMPPVLKALCLLPILLVSPFSLAEIGYSQNELKALAQQERNVLPPDNQASLDALLRRSQQHQQEALSMNQHIESALQGSPLASVLGTPTVNPNKDAQGVMVFVSLSMPDRALQQLLRQSQQYQVPLVIRGVLPGGMVPTATRMMSLLEMPDGETIESGIAISPQWFKQFNVTQVPAFVAIGEHCQENACAEGEYDVVYGNVSLPQALDMLRRGEVGHIAEQIIKRSSP